MHVSTVLIRMSFCLMIISKFQIICLATKSIAYYIYMKMCKELIDRGKGVLAADIH